MHISSLHLYTYTPTQLIDGNVEISHEGVTVKLALDESDRRAIQELVTNAFIAERKKMADIILNNTPAFVALPSPVAEDAEFESITDDEEI